LHLRLADTVNANTSTGIPLGVVGRPDEIADAVVWMVKTGYFANKVVIVDGGMLPQQPSFAYHDAMTEIRYERHLFEWTRFPCPLAA
jgi:hypothetical protein